MGSGNVAWHLHRGLMSAGHEIIQVYTPHQLERARELSPAVINDLSLLDTSADLWLMALKDDVLQSTANQLPSGPVLAHTSGRASLDVLQTYPGKKAVFYPLQSLSRGVEIPFSSIPFLIESDDDASRADLMALAQSMGSSAQFVSSSQRAELHVAAVFVNNFVNYLYEIGFDILAKSDLPFDLLKPLIAETARKINDLHPHQAQTGPAKRRDVDTINAHLKRLENMPEWHALYRELSNRITSKHETEL